MNDNRMWMPMMLFSGLINVMMFASMMSFIGMAMNLDESAQTEGQVDQSGAGGESAGPENSGAAADTGDTGDFSDVGGGGMDTGGFDSF